jgi:hypothetical protein
MEAMLEMSPYSYLYLKLAKMLCLSIYLLFYYPGSRGVGRRGEREVGGRGRG